MNWNPFKRQPKPCLVCLERERDLAVVRALLAQTLVRLDAAERTRCRDKALIGSLEKIATQAAGQASALAALIDAVSAEQTATRARFQKLTPHPRAVLSRVLEGDDHFTPHLDWNSGAKEYLNLNLSRSNNDLSSLMRDFFATRTNIDSTIAWRQLEAGIRGTGVVLGRGPQSGISPTGSEVLIGTSDSIQAAIDANPAGTSFRLAVGTHTISTGIIPKAGNTFIGYYGAIIDGTGWSSTDVTVGGFQAHNIDVDNVTIKNLTIQHMPMRAIHAFGATASGWTVDHCALINSHTGIQICQSSTVSNNVITGNIGPDPNDPTPAQRGGGYIVYQANNITFSNNEIGNCGPEQKIVDGDNCNFTDNYVHDNYSEGIWYDTDCTGAVISGNTVENNGGSGIEYEVCENASIYNNTLTDNLFANIFISCSKGIEIYSNTLTGSPRSIWYFLDCDRVGTGAISADLYNVNSHDNTITLTDANPGTYASTLSFLGTCDASERTPYKDGTKLLVWQNNHYHVVNQVHNNFYFDGEKSWSGWQAIPQDSTGDIS